jgi:hypothetical protein
MTDLRQSTAHPGTVTELMGHQGCVLRSTSGNHGSLMTAYLQPENRFRATKAHQVKGPILGAWMYLGTGGALPALVAQCVKGLIPR